MESIRGMESILNRRDMESMGWELGKELGSGHFAKVYLVTRKSDGRRAACKIIKKPKEMKKRQLVAMEHKIRLR